MAAVDKGKTQRLARRRAGRCERGCGRRWQGPPWTCTDCTIRKSEVARVRLEARAKAGICLKCPNRAQLGRLLCRRCNQKNNRRGSKIYYERKLQAGAICMRGKHENDQPDRSAICRQCTIDARERGKRNYHRRRRRLERKGIKALFQLAVLGYPVRRLLPPPTSPLAEPPPHGTTKRYYSKIWPCKCAECRRAVALYAQRLRQTLHDGVIPNARGTR